MKTEYFLSQAASACSEPTLTTLICSMSLKFRRTLLSDGAVISKFCLTLCENHRFSENGTARAMYERSSQLTIKTSKRRQ